ncbi:membrane transport protein [Salmonella enterica subsp. enterica]|uniref:Membrane transport protein n=1 Tax=Salmonella enterica I TaxID=59201 RepID=A0A3S4HTD8_SALET|nr:membrane transport protein [Salmonella enterica subsp. enterica]
MLAVITRLFPLWALLLSLIAYYTPSTFTPVGPWVATLLMLIMFGMGVHLNVDDFKRVLSRPAPVAAGIFLHYLVMPLAAWLLALLFKMPPDLSAGMVLVGSVASGTASKRNDLSGEGRRRALSHHFIGLHAGRRGRHTTTHAPVTSMPIFKVDVMGMLLSILQIVVIPITLGLVIHHLFPRVVKVVKTLSCQHSRWCGILAIIQRGGRGFSFTYRLRRLYGDHRGDPA